MKRLIAVAVALTLAVGSAFAVDFTGQIHSGVTLMHGNDSDYDEEDDRVHARAGGHMGRFRLQAAAENEEGTFGAWMRLQGSTDPGIEADTGLGSYGYGAIPFSVTGHAWWRPADIFWMAIGTNPDGFFNAEGGTGWQFYGAAGDARVANAGNFNGFRGFASPTPTFTGNGGNGNGNGNGYDNGDRDDFDVSIRTRDAFFSGFGCANRIHAGAAEWGLAFTISPIEILNLNFGIPFISEANEPFGDVFGALTAQLELNLDFGRIAITYDGQRADSGALFAYFGMGGPDDDLRLDIGLGVHLYNDDADSVSWLHDSARIFAGVGLGLGISDDIGLRARLVAGFGGGNDDYDAPFSVFLDLLPFFSVNDNLTAFVSLGASLHAVDGGMDGNDNNIFDFHINPYLQISSGPASFFAGFRMWTEWGGTDLSSFHWAVPIGITINF